MSCRVKLPVTLELLSDTIFGSGYSIPGGEDTAVCQNEQGYPYVKGSTWKGLLRESLEDLAAWGGTDPENVGILLGEEDWSGLADSRRVRFTALTLNSPPEDPEDCRGLRAFTALENGTVKQGTLRTAACAQGGLTFSGHLECEAGDVPLLRDALRGVKWAGTHRSRGFGRVRFTAEEAQPLTMEAGLTSGTCLRFRLKTLLPVMVTDQTRSDGNNYETQGFLPGSAIRGAVMGRLAANDPMWFEANKRALLSDDTRFLDAVPSPFSLPPLPALRGFYEDKEETCFKSVVIDGPLASGLKRAGVGSFCAIEGDSLRYWSAHTGGGMRIRRGKNGKDTAPFQVRWLDQGQEFEGYILLEDPALSPKIAQALGDTLWLGADRFSGFGKCGITRLEAARRPAWLDVYGYEDQTEVGKDLYLLAVSPLTMLDEKGEPRGLDEEELAKQLGVEQVELLHCATALTQAGGYNRVWQCRAPMVQMYDRGSLFHLRCGQPPKLERIRRVQEMGLGIRRAEGFGQVLFLRPALVEGLRRKLALAEGTGGADSGAGLRQARYRWVMEHSKVLSRSGLSKSQAGTIQALCEKAMARGGDLSELEAHLEHNLTNRGAVHAARFKEAAKLIREVLDRPLGQTLGAKNCPDSVRARLELLCLLFDHSRKGREED